MVVGLRFPGLETMRKEADLPCWESMEEGRDARPEESAGRRGIAVMRRTQKSTAQSGRPLGPEPR